MRARHYQLLGIKGGDFRGPLAAFAKTELGADARARALLRLSRVLPTGVNLLGLKAEVGSRGDFHASATGLLARRLGRKLADNVNQSVLRKGEPLVTRGDQLIYTLYQPPIPSRPMVKVLASRLNLERTGRPLPATHTMQITTACQCDCIHCSAARHRRSERPELTTEECKAFIRQSQELGVVNIILTGGEPLLRRDIFELISFIDKDEAIAMIFTNGMLLTEENVAKLREAGLFSLMVSLDSPDAAQHDEMRRVHGCWGRAVEGIQRCLAAGLLCGISTYATPERLHNGKVMEMIELGRGLGVQEVTVFDVVPTGRLMRQDESELLTDQDKQELCALEEEINARPGWPHVITQAHVNGPTGAGCYAGWFQFYSTAYGDVTPCDFTPLTFGNIRDESLQAIWDRIASHAAYCERSNHCRMQDHEFRRQWIDRIPNRGPFPHPIALLEDASYQPVDDDELPVGSSLGIKA